MRIYRVGEQVRYDPPDPFEPLETPWLERATAPSTVASPPVPSRPTYELRGPLGHLWYTTPEQLAPWSP